VHPIKLSSAKAMPAKAAVEFLLPLMISKPPDWPPRRPCPSTCATRPVQAPDPPAFAAGDCDAQTPRETWC